MRRKLLFVIMIALAIVFIVQPWRIQASERASGAVFNVDTWQVEP